MARSGKLAVVVAMVCFSGLALAQGGATGAVTGTVQDASGAVISGANVNVINESTGQVLRQARTDSSGTFTATLLPVGNYSLEVSAPGFATSKVSGIIRHRAADHGDYAAHYCVESDFRQRIA